MKLQRLFKLLEKHKLTLELHLLETEYEIKIVSHSSYGEGSETMIYRVPLTHIQEDVVSVVERHITANKSNYEKLRSSLSSMNRWDTLFSQHLILFADEFENTLIDDEARKRKGKLAPSRGRRGGGSL